MAKQHYLSQDIPTASFIDSAVRSGDINIVKYIIDPILRKYGHFRDISSSDSDSDETPESSMEYLQSALAIAVKYGYQDIIDLLIDLGVDDFSEALYAAARQGDMKKINYLISRSKQNINWNSGLAGAARGGFRPIIDFMIEKGASDLDRAVSAAASGGHLSIVEYLISRGGKVTVPTLYRVINTDNITLFLALMKYINLDTKIINNLIRRARHHHSVKLLRKLLT